MDIEEKTEPTPEIVAERERLRVALVRFINQRTGYTSEIQRAWTVAYPGVALFVEPPQESTSASEAVLAERRRVAHAMVELAREEQWCNEYQRVWRAVMPGVEMRDSDGYDCHWYNEEGKHRYDDPALRPPQPEGTKWCTSCRAWEQA